MFVELFKRYNLSLKVVPSFLVLAVYKKFLEPRPGDESLHLYFNKSDKLLDGQYSRRNCKKKKKDSGITGGM